MSAVPEKPERVNCKAKKRYQVDLRTPNTSGDLAAPAAGTVTGILLRLSTAKYGPQIHADVGSLPASETSGKAGRFYYEVSKALQETYLLPLGVGASFWTVWSKANEFDMESHEFIVDEGHTIP